MVRAYAAAATREQLTVARPVRTAPPPTHRDPSARSAPASTRQQQRARSSDRCEPSASISTMTSYPRSSAQVKASRYAAQAGLAPASTCTRGRQPPARRASSPAPSGGAGVVDHQDVGVGDGCVDALHRPRDVEHLVVGGHGSTRRATRRISRSLPAISPLRRVWVGGGHRALLPTLRGGRAAARSRSRADPREYVHRRAEWSARPPQG